MQTTTLSGTSFKGLIREFKDEAKTLVRQEIQLAKREMSEKISSLGRNAITLAIGGFAAYAGLIVFLGALGVLLALAWQKLDISSTLAFGAGLGLVAFVVMAAGGVMIMKALAGFKEAAPVTPQKTIETLKHLKGEEQTITMKPEPEEEDSEAPKPSSDEIQAGVLVTENLLQDTASEIRRRVSPKYVNERVKGKYREHPYRWNVVAMASGVAGGFLVKHKMRHGHG